MVVIITTFMTAFLGSALNIAVPSMGSDLGISAASTGWIISVYALVTSALSVPFGKVADSTSRRSIFLTGLLTMTVGSLLASVCGSFAAVMAMRILQSIGASMIFATNTATIVSNYPPAQKGKAIGMMTAGTYTGLSSGPVLGGIINHCLGWHGIFLLAGLVSLCALILGYIFLPRNRQTAAAGTGDIAGGILFIAMITLMMTGFSSAGTGAMAWLLLGAGAVLAVLFTAIEKRAANPLIDVRIFRRNPAYTLSNLAALFNYCATFGISYFMSIFLQTDMGFSSQRAGLILLCQPLVMALVSPRMGALSDRIAPWKLATAGMAVCGSCLVCFSFVRHGIPLALLVTLLLITGLGVSIFSSPNMNAIMSCVDRSHFGIASSILATMRTLGQTSSMCIITIIIHARLKNLPLQSASTQQLEGAMHLSFLLLAAICFTGMIMSMQRRRNTRND